MSRPRRKAPWLWPGYITRYVEPSVIVLLDTSSSMEVGLIRKILLDILEAARKTVLISPGRPIYVSYDNKWIEIRDGSDVENLEILTNPIILVDAIENIIGRVLIRESPYIVIIVSDWETPDKREALENSIRRLRALVDLIILVTVHGGIPAREETKICILRYEDKSSLSP